MKKSNVERILHGNLASSLFVVSLPLMLNNLIQTLYNLGDALWVGRMGPTEFAATSFVWPVLFFFISIGIGINMAGTSILSQLVGARNRLEAKEYTSLIFAISFLFSILVMIAGYFTTPMIITWMGAQGQLREFSIIYLQILFFGMPFQFIYNICAAVFQAQGNTLITTVMSAISATLNMVLNPFFIFDIIPGTSMQGLGWGIAGAAWATVISQGLLCLIGYLLVRAKSEEIEVRPLEVQWDAQRVKRIRQVAIPSTIGQSGAALGFILTNGFIAEFGTNTVAAVGLANRISGLGMLPAMGIGSAITTIVGQNIGNGRIDRAKKGFHIALLLAFVLTIILSIPILLFDKEIIQFFLPTDDGTEVLTLASRFLVFAVLINPLMGFFSTFQGFFQGTGYTRYSMLMEVLRLWGIRIPFIFILQFLGLWTQDGIWYAMIVSNLLVIVLGWFFYHGKRWEKSLLTEV